MWQDLTRAWSQLGDRRVLKVLALGALATVPVFALLYWALDQGTTAATAQLAARLDQTIGWQRWLGGLVRALDGFVALLAALVALWFLFPPLATAVMGVWLDDVVDAVEDRHYPLHRAPQPASLGLGLRLGLASAGRLVIWNLALSPLYIALLVTGLGPALLFLLVNGILLGRDYAEMVMMRHMPAGEARALIGQRPLATLGPGLLAAVLFLFPLTNLLAPLVGAALATHAAHRAMGHDRA